MHFREWLTVNEIKLPEVMNSVHSMWWTGLLDKELQVLERLCATTSNEEAVEKMRRKLRLFACGCVKQPQVYIRLTEIGKDTLEVAERHASGTMSDRQLMEAYKASEEDCLHQVLKGRGNLNAAIAAMETSRNEEGFCRSAAYAAAYSDAWAAADPTGCIEDAIRHVDAFRSARGEQIHLFHQTFDVMSAAVLARAAGIECTEYGGEPR